MAWSLRKVVSARVAQSNTPETDAMREVMHLVSGVSESGEEWTVRHMSRDPVTALNEVAVMGEEQFQELLRASARQGAVQQ